MTGRRRFGAIRRLPSGRYQARYQLAAGQLVPAERTFATKAEADRYLAQLELDLARGTWVDPRQGRVLVGEWAWRWLDGAVALKPKTRAGYASIIRSVIDPTLGTACIGDLRPSQIREWVAALTRRGLSASRVRQSYRLLSMTMKAAQLDGLIATNPCVGVRLPRIPEHEPNVLTPEDVDRVAAACPAPYDLFVLTLAYTGLRFGEAAALRRWSLRLDQAVLVVSESLSDADGVLTFQAPKNHQHRRVTMPAFLCRLLDAHMRSRPSDAEVLVFGSPEGLPLRHPNFMRRVWQPALHECGLTATPHDLRASHATWLYDAGWSPVEIGGRLGHSSATVTTKHYARRVVGRDAEIAAGLDVLRGDSRQSPETGRAR